MKFSTQTYFVEHEDEAVKGFSIIDTNEQSGRYQIAEKWVASNASSADSLCSALENDKWLTYWIPEKKLLDRIAAGHCEQKARLSQKQYDAVRSKIEHESISAEGIA